MSLKFIFSRATTADQVVPNADNSRLLGGYDTATVEGRSRERYRRAILTTGSYGLAKTISILTGLISVPLTLHYLGVERYGLWMTISSLIASVGFSDFGINNSLLTGIAKAHGSDDRELARRYVSSAFFSLLAVATALALLFAIAYPFVHWGTIFHVNSPSAMAEAGPGVAVLMMCFILGIPINLVTRIQSGYQEGFSAQLWITLGSVMSLLALLAVISVRGSLPLLVLALAGAPLVASAANGFCLFSFQRQWLTPAWPHVTREVSRELLHSGFLFFVLQLAMAVSFSSDNLVIANVLGPAAVTQYSIPARLFGQINFVSAVIAAPLWPAYTEALVKRDFAWIRTTLQRSFLLLVSIAVAASTFLLYFGRQILALWVGPTVRPSPLLMASLAVWSVVNACGVPVAMLLNAANVVKFQVIVSIVASLTNIVLSVFLTRRVGVAGVALGSIIAQTVAVLVPYYFFVFRGGGVIGRYEKHLGKDTCRRGSSAAHQVY